MRRNEPDKAYEALQEAIALDHSCAWTMILAAVLARDRGHIKHAKILLSRAAANPDTEDQTVRESDPKLIEERAIANILVSNLHREELDEKNAQFATLEAQRLAKRIKSSLPGDVVHLVAAERFAESANQGVAQKMLAQYLASIKPEHPIPGQALLLKSKLEMWRGELEAALNTGNDRDILFIIFLYFLKNKHLC